MSHPSPSTKPSSPLSLETNYTSLLHTPSQYLQSLPSCAYTQIPPTDSPTYLHSHMQLYPSTFRLPVQSNITHQRALFGSQPTTDMSTHRMNKKQISLTVKILDKQIEQLQLSQKMLERKFQYKIWELIEGLRRCDQQQIVMRCEMIEMKTLLKERKWDLEMIRNALERENEERVENREEQENLWNLMEKEKKKAVRSLSQRAARSQSNNRSVSGKSRRQDLPRPKTPYRIMPSARNIPKKGKKPPYGLFIPSTPKLFY